VTYDGFKLRTLFVVPNAPARQFFYGVNSSSATTRVTGIADLHRRDPPIIGWRSGPIEFIVNPILDYTSQGVAGLDFAPATRLAWRITEAWTVAAEEYDDFGPCGASSPRGSNRINCSRSWITRSAGPKSRPVLGLG